MPKELLSEEWTRHIEGEDIEYTRTDAFIEKAEKFIKSYLRETSDRTGYIRGIVDEEMIEGFKNYITQEDKVLLLKDLCARLPYGVMYYS